MILGTCLSCHAPQFFIIAERFFLVIDDLSLSCPVSHFPNNAVFFVEVIFYLLKLPEMVIFTT